MPYSFARFLAESGRSIPMPRFDPPSLAPLRKPIAESTVGVFWAAVRNCPKIRRSARPRISGFGRCPATSRSPGS